MCTFNVVQARVPFSAVVAVYVEVFGPNFCLFFFLNMLPAETFNIYCSLARAKMLTATVNSFFFWEVLIMHFILLFVDFCIHIDYQIWERPRENGSRVYFLGRNHLNLT